MNTVQLHRTSIVSSALAAALLLLTLVGAPAADADRPDAAGTSTHGAALEIDQVVAMLKAAAAQYRVDHARELG
jgi:hypothetical protein